MFQSIQWKMGAVYLFLILIAMQVIGVHLLQSLQQYYEDNYASGLASQGELIAGLVQRHLEEEAREAEIADLVGEFRLETGHDIAVMDENGMVLGATTGRQDLLGRRLAQPEVTRALAGQPATQIWRDPARQERMMSVTMPIERGNRVLGAVHLTGSLAEMDATLADIRSLLAGATALALGITAVIGVALARTITGPIREVTAGAQRIAGGDYDQTITVRSADEIGQLAQAFNYLSSRLQTTLREIAREKSRVEGILAYLNDGVVALDGEGQIIHLNPAAGRLLELETGEAYGQPWQEVAALSPVRRALEQAWREQRPASVLLRRHNGEQFLRVHFNPLREQEQGDGGLVLALQDVTEQERLDRMRREFVANVSHELRTPLTTVKSYVETLLDGALEDRQVARPFLEVVGAETDRMARLVSDLLQLSQLDSQAVRWNWREVHLPDVLERVTRRWRPELEQKGLSFSVRAEPGLPRVRADADRLDQLLENLLSNAVKFTPGGGWIRVAMHSRGDMVRTEIADSGIGIPEDDLSRIFERFYRADKARSRAQGGTGLGLSIARQIVEGHGGRIEIGSRPEEGTRVSFTLPRAGECLQLPGGGDNRV